MLAGRVRCEPLQGDAYASAPLEGEVLFVTRCTMPLFHGRGVFSYNYGLQQQAGSGVERCLELYPRGRRLEVVVSGLALWEARGNNRRSTDPEFQGAARCRLVVVALKVGGCLGGTKRKRSCNASRGARPWPQRGKAAAAYARRWDTCRRSRRRALVASLSSQPTLATPLLGRRALSSGICICVSHMYTNGTPFSVAWFCPPPGKII